MKTNNYKRWNTTLQPIITFPRRKAIGQPPDDCGSQCILLNTRRAAVLLASCRRRTPAGAPAAIATVVYVGRVGYVATPDRLRRTPSLKSTSCSHKILIANKPLIIRRRRISTWRRLKKHGGKLLSISSGCSPAKHLIPAPSWY